MGLRSIPLRQIVGTEGRGGDFDRSFLPRRPDVGARWQRLEHAFPDGDFPPIVVYQLGDAYFVIDGHHRVAIARQQGMETIDGEVTELRARWHLPANADVVELLHAEQERIFMDESGLGRVRPEIQIRFSRPVGFVELLENVQIHGYRLILEAGRAIAPADIARDWYERIYVPTVEAIRHEGLDRVCPEATDPDRFLWVHERRRELVPERGWFPLDETARQATDERRKESRRRVRRLVAGKTAEAITSR